MWRVWALNGTLGDEQLLLDDAAGLPLGQKRQHLLLARAQTVGADSSATRSGGALLLGRALARGRPPAGCPRPTCYASSFSENSSTVAAKMSTDTSDRHRESLGGRRQTEHAQRIGGARRPAAADCSAFLMAMNATMATPRRLAMSKSRNITREDIERGS